MNVRQLHPVVFPQVSHLRHVPLRTSVKFPHSVQASPVYPLSRASAILSASPLPAASAFAVLPAGCHFVSTRAAASASFAGARSRFTAAADTVGACVDSAPRTALPMAASGVAPAIAVTEAPPDADPVVAFPPVPRAPGSPLTTEPAPPRDSPPRSTSASGRL